MNQIIDMTEGLWNFGQVVFKNRIVDKEDTDKLEVPESIRLAKCRSRSWA